MRNVLMDEQHDPATMAISVFSIYTIWASFREEFWSCNRAVDFCFLNSYNMWLMKVKESQQFQFFASYAIHIHTNEFQSTNKAVLICFWILFVPQGEDLYFFSFIIWTNLFSVFKFICSPKKESEKLKNSHFGQIHVQVLFFHSFILSFCNEWEFIMAPHITTVTLNCLVTI